MSDSADIVFLSGVRTGFGSFGGSLKDFSATDLGTHAAQAAIQRSGVEPGAIDHVVFGNVLQTSADAIYLARHVGLRSGLPIETPAVTVNRLCGSGFEAVRRGLHRGSRRVRDGRRRDRRAAREPDARRLQRGRGRPHGDGHARVAAG